MANVINVNFSNVINVDFEKSTITAEEQYALDRAAFYLEQFFSAKSAESEEYRLDSYLLWANRANQLSNK